MPDLSDNSNTEDVEWMQRIASGDHQAFRSLVEKHQHAVVGTVAKMLGSSTDSEDLAQQVFLRIWKSAKRYKPTAKFTTWMFTITRNLVFNESRRRSRRKTESIDAADDEFGPRLPDTSSASPDDALLQRELTHAVDQAIAELPEKQRLAVVLRRQEKLPYDEIAKVLDLSVSAVKSQLFRARETLKTSLAAYLGPES